MEPRRGRILRIRQQLWLLFGLMLATGASVLLLDEVNYRGTLETFAQLREESLAGVRHVKIVSDAYGFDVVDTTFRVRNSLMGWEQGVEVLDRATERIQEHWQGLVDMSMPGEQRALVTEIGRARETADRAAAKLRAILKSQDIAALGKFADVELYPAIDPVTRRLQFLSDLKMEAARRHLEDDADRTRLIGWWRVGLSLFTFIVVLVAGRQVLRQIYRGVETLVRLARAMRRSVFDAPVGELPRGELGDVATAFLEMRDSLRQKATELTESEARAQDASRAKSAFLAAMSHEIRTPMVGVTGMLELLSHTSLDPEQRHCVDVIDSSAQSLLQIIGDILDFSKIEAGKLDLAPEAVDLRKLVEASANNFLGVASGKGVKLDWHIDASVGAAHRADPLRLRQVLSNLLSNALKFTHKGGVTLEVETLMQEGEIETIAFRVHDTGIGIAQDQQDKLFSAFSQAESGTARQYGGTGLGLAICRRLAQLMGGELGLRSQLGEGTTVSLVLPLPRADVQMLAATHHAMADDFPQRSAPGIAEAEAERSLVLLVDDHPTNREVITRQLARAGYASEMAIDGEDALAHWKSGRYALVLADIHMPRLDGYGLVAAIRNAEQREGRSRTPVIALTANVSKGEAERCIAAGMDDFLPKPVPLAQLARRLRLWLPHAVFPAAGESAPPPTAVPAPAPASAIVPPLDLSVLHEIAGDDAGVAHEILGDFLNSTKRDVAALEVAYVQGNRAELAREAHRIKGAARLVGADTLGRCVAEIEAAARTPTQELPPLEPLHAAIRSLRWWHASGN